MVLKVLPRGQFGRAAELFESIWQPEGTMWGSRRVMREGRICHIGEGLFGSH